MSAEEKQEKTPQMIKVRPMTKEEAQLFVPFFRETLAFTSAEPERESGVSSTSLVAPIIDAFSEGKIATIVLPNTNSIIPHGGTFRPRGSQKEIPTIVVPQRLIQKLSGWKDKLNYDIVRDNFFDPDGVIGELWRAGVKTGIFQNPPRSY